MPVLDFNHPMRTLYGQWTTLIIDEEASALPSRLMVEEEPFTEGFFVFPSLPPLPIQGSVLDRFGDVAGVDLLFSRQVGDGAGQLEDAVVGAGGETQGVEGLLQQIPGLRIQAAVTADEGWRHGGVVENPGSLVAFRLDGMGTGHPFPDGGGGFPFLSGRECLIIHPGHFHMDVDPVQERAGQFGSVTADLLMGTGAGPVFLIPEVTAGTGIHGADQHKFRREREHRPGPGHGHFPVFQGLTQHFQGAFGKLGHLIQEENPPV